jgi:DNA-binding protein HU-beta
LFWLKFNNNNLKLLSMSKSRFIDAIAADAGISKASAKKALDSFLSNVSSDLKKGERVSLVGFGSFSVSNRAARTGRNPQTGKEIKIAAKNVVRFKAGADLSGTVNGGKK